jgi:hypothetical protein
MPKVQEQCAHFQVIRVVSRGNHYVNYYQRERHCPGPIRDSIDDGLADSLTKGSPTPRHQQADETSWRRMRQHPVPNACDIQQPTESPVFGFLELTGPAEVPECQYGMASHISTGQASGSEKKNKRRRERKWSANPEKKTDKSHRRRIHAGVKKKHQNAQVGRPDGIGERGHKGGKPLVRLNEKEEGWERRGKQGRQAQRNRQPAQIKGDHNQSQM